MQNRDSSQNRQSRSSSHGGSNRQQRTQQNAAGLRITYLQNPQVELIKHDKVIGQGVKKTLAYDTPMTREQLENWRKEFWGKSTAAGATVPLPATRLPGPWLRERLRRRRRAWPRGKLLM